MADSPKKMVMRQSEVIQAGLLLQDNMKKGANGYAEYNEGWSDERIAAIVGRVNAEHIARLRLNLGLKTQQYRKQDNAELRARLDLLTEKHNELCDKLHEAGILTTLDGTSATQFKLEL